MSDTAQCVKTLIHGVAQDNQNYQALHTLLGLQREHIVARNTDELNAVNTQIMTVYQQLSQSSQHRYQSLDKLGIAANAHGMQTLISRLPAPHQQTVSNLWTTLQQQAADCHSANEYNGSLMTMQQEILTNLLNISEPENWLYQQG